MKKNIKVIVGMCTLVAILTACFENDLVMAQAGTNSVKTCLDDYNSGVASLLDPTNSVIDENIELIETEEADEQCYQYTKC